MLPARHRMRRSSDFREAVRRGRRAGTSLLVVHLLPQRPLGEEEDRGAAAPASAGLVVSKAVGGAVVRTAVKRRLRHVLAGRVPALPPGSRLVVRASPEAASASSEQLAAALDRALRVTSSQRPRTAAARTARTTP